MNLRHQLLLVSLLFLCLPWAGCELVRETESILLSGQKEALSARAEAVALRLEGQPALANLAAFQAGSKGPASTYFHALDMAPVIDGFNDDWLQENSPISALTMQSEHRDRGSSGKIYSGTYGDSHYLYIQIDDATENYLNPALNPLRSGDYLRLRRGTLPDLFLGVSGPGNVQARYEEDGEIRSEYGLSGVWRRRGGSYHIELRLRPRLLDQQFGLEYVDMGAPGTTLMHAMFAGQPLPYVASDQTLFAAIASFSTPDSSIAIVDRDGWLYAHVKEHEANPYSEQLHFLLRTLYSLVLHDNDIASSTHWQRSGRLPDGDVQAALRGGGVTFLAADGSKLIRASASLYQNDIQVGAVVIEQGSDSLTQSTNRVFNRLMLLTLIAALFLAGGFVAYATWLSYRIARLSRAAESAMDEKGTINRNFPVSRAQDEIGDLSRSFDQLLGRLREYTEYLRSLSGKLSHELKTPLAVVKSSLENLQHHDLDAQALLCAERASDGANRLSTIFEALSGATRLEQSIDGAEVAPVKMVAFMHTLHLAYKDAYPGVPILFDPPKVTADGSIEDVEASIAPELFVQMLDKIVDNAVDFCHDNGEVCLYLSIERDQFSISVSNDGPLLPAAMHAQLFDSLVSVRPSDAGGSATKSSVHMGLGMYVARLIAEFHRGTVTAKNREDESGVVVTMCFPRP